ncbi:putative esterase [Cronobacter condimenti 1330]|nr:putative esterase [Cronobacter condimenti 1330]
MKRTTFAISLLLGMAASPGEAASCLKSAVDGELAGTFDNRGRVCIIQPVLGENYVAATLTGAREAQLMDGQQQPLRRLVTRGPADGTHSLLFALPVRQPSTLILEGAAGTTWSLRWQAQETVPLAREQAPEPVSPTLQALARHLSGGGDTQAFWRNIAERGTPLVEPVDDNHRRITFLWRGARKNVFILGSPAGDHDPLFRLGLSDVWFRSYVVPADTLMQYKLAPDVPQIHGTPREQRRAILATAQADPLNPQQFLPSQEDRWNRYSLVTMGGARQCGAAGDLNGVRNGTLTRHAFTSARLNNTRDIQLYRPATPARWTLMVFDGNTYQDDYRLASVVDRLITARRLPPLNVVFIDSLDFTRRSKELPPNRDFADMMALELLPWLRAQGLAPQGRRTIVTGSSYGGLAASWVALRHPTVFGNVLSLSGSYWWAPKGEPASWLTREYERAPRLTVRFWLEAGRFETQGPDGGIYQNTREFEHVLREKGYAVSFHPWASGHDYVSWCEAMMQGVKYLTESRREHGGSG